MQKFVALNRNSFILYELHGASTKFVKKKGNPCFLTL